MSSVDKQKSLIHALNVFFIPALLSIFITGILLIIIVFIFALPSFNLVFLQVLSVILLFLGIFFIIFGLIQSIGLMKRMKKVTDLILSGKLIISEPSTQTSSGVGRGLQIIRPSMTPSDEQRIEKPKTLHKEKEIQKPKRKVEIEPQPVSKIKETEPNIEEEAKGVETLDISLEDALQKIVERYNDPKVSSSFSNWDDTLMMTFPDVDKSYLFKINRDQGIHLTEGYNEEAAVQVKVDSDIYIKMMTNQINPIKAYSSGKLEVVGKMRSLLKLRKLMF